METTTPKIPNIVSPQQRSKKRKMHYVIVISVIIIAPFLTFILPSRFGHPFKMQINVSEKIFGAYGNIFLSSLNEGEVLRAKAYVYNKYHPGNCFGMPTVMTDFEEKEFNNAITKYPTEAELLRTVYGLQTDQQLAGAILGMRRIRYQDHLFTFTDGNCCNTMLYIVSIKKTDTGFIDRVLYQKKHSSIPC